MRELFCICCFSFLFFACKKEEKQPDPAPAPVPVTPVQPELSVKINGQAFTCNACFSSYYSGGLYGVNFYMGSSGDRFVINFSDYPDTGTYQLRKYGDPFYNYQDPSFTYEKNNVYFRGRGTLRITAIDTSASGTVAKLSASFNCLTDTAGQEYFNISEGKINKK